MKSKMYTSALILLLPLIGWAQTDLTISITNMESTDGEVVFMLFDQDEGFPSEVSKAKQIGKVKATKDTPTFTFKNVPAGKYAISAFQDENDNGEVDTNFIGLPKERVGAVGHTKFGKPNFDKLVFEIGQGDAAKSLSLNFIN